MIKHSSDDNVAQVGSKKFGSRFVYNSRCKPKDVESQMVRPLQYSFMLCRSVLNSPSDETSCKGLSQCLGKVDQCSVVSVQPLKRGHTNMVSNGKSLFGT